jgi:hypothetical protein
MKKVLFALKSALALCTLAFVFTSCSKDDDSNPLNGLWAFKDANVIYYLNGQAYNVKEEGGDLTEVNQSFRGWSFEFTSQHVTMRVNGQTSPQLAYSLSGNVITIRFEDNYAITWRYNVSGNTLELTWTRQMMEMMGGSMPPEFYEFDDIEFILSFNKIN